MTAKVAVVGCGWWSQGWHLPQISRNPDVELVAIVDSAEHPQSKLNPDLVPLSVLADKYGCQVYSSLADLLQAERELNGVLICTPHATHYPLGLQVLEACTKRRIEAAANGTDYRPIHILMEKPMTTSVTQALKLEQAVQEYRKAGGLGSFAVNHSGNFRQQTAQAREIIQSGRLGEIRHVTAFFASPLSWIFDDPSLKGWNEPTGDMLGNGFSWGQATHLVAWVWYVTGLEPQSVSCHMTHSEATGADVAFTASISCRSGAVVSLSGTSLLPGHAHSDPPVGKRLTIEVYGSSGGMTYSGIDTDPSSGNLQVMDGNGKTEIVNDSFVFEELEMSGTGPESLQCWIRACQGRESHIAPADVELGRKTIQTVSALYKSYATKGIVSIET